MVIKPYARKVFTWLTKNVDARSEVANLTFFNAEAELLCLCNSILFIKSTEASYRGLFTENGKC